MLRAAKGRSFIPPSFPPVAVSADQCLRVLAGNDMARPPGLAGSHSVSIEASPARRSPAPPRPWETEYRVQPARAPRDAGAAKPVADYPTRC